jgi:hypothetical protein
VAGATVARPAATARAFSCGITLSKRRPIMGWLYKHDPIDDPVVFPRITGINQKFH